MGPHPNLLLVLMLCLAQTIHTQKGVLPKPSIRAKLGPVIHWEQPVTIMRWGPAGTDLFHLVQNENTSVYWDQNISSPHGSQGAETTFHVNVKPVQPGV
ncbi:leukocyte associated immunoglobulin like receptor 2 [Phyllostomus discolor]|nr:leukocyte associated immunoglobulin like receptor 2 [Phyllostomus discolor]